MSRSMSGSPSRSSERKRSNNRPGSVTAAAGGDLANSRWSGRGPHHQPVDVRWHRAAAGAGARLHVAGGRLDRRHRRPGAAQRRDDQGRGRRRRPAPAPGFVLDAQGYILTNNHVVAAAGGGGNITVELLQRQDARPATIVGRDASYDLAVLKVDRDRPPAAAARAPSDVVVGDPVIAIGCAARPGRHRDHRHRQRAEPAGHRRARTGDQSLHQRDPDRRRDQPRQLRRPAARHARARSSASTRAIAARARQHARHTGGNIGVGFAIPSDQARRDGRAADHAPARRRTP